MLTTFGRLAWIHADGRLAATGELAPESLLLEHGSRTTIDRILVYGDDDAVHDRSHGRVSVWQSLTKDDLLAALNVERRYWDALVALVEERCLMDRPGACGSAWTFKDLLAHLNGWRTLTVARLEAPSRGEPPVAPWPSHLEENDEGRDTINAWFHDRAGDRPAVALLTDTDEQFNAMESALRSTSSQDLLTPGRFDWMGGRPIGPAALGWSFMHLHKDHEPAIRNWLVRETDKEPTLPPPPPTFGFGGPDDVWEAEGSLSNP